VRRRALGALLALALGTIGMSAPAVAVTAPGCAPSPTFVDIPKLAGRVRLDDARVMPDGSLLAVGVRTTSRGSALVSLDGVPGAWSWTTSRIQALIGAVSGESSDDAWALAFRVPFDAVAHWDGSTWTLIDHPPRPAGLTPTDQFALVDIASAGDTVWVVGSVSRFLGPGDWITRPYAAVWDGSAWTRAPVPRPATDRAELFSVSGTGADDVWAVGLADPLRRPLVEHWDGSAWSIVAFPEATGFAYLNSVDAASPKLAWAIGPYQHGAFSWNGTDWTQHAGAGYGVSVAGPADVWSGGEGYWYTDHWNGDGWTELSMPQRANPRWDEEMSDVEATRGGDQTFFVGSADVYHREIPLVVRICPWDVTDTGPADPVASVHADAPGVLWRFPRSNTASTRLLDASDLHLFDTGARRPGSTFAWQYPGVGTYPFRVEPSGTTGVVRVPVGARYFPGPGLVQLSIGPAAGAPDGLDCEVQVRAPGSTTFETIFEGPYCVASEYPVDGPGTYSFRGRSFDPGTGASSEWSPTRSITVGT
jgi:hypothetical protein